MAKTIGQEQDDKAMEAARKAWQKEYPIRWRHHSLVSDSYDAGFVGGMARGISKRGCCEERDG